MLTLPSLRRDPHTRLVACAAPREESRAAFLSEFDGQAHASVETLCSDPAVEAIYIATPHQMHRDHAVSAARAGKHILVDKPLAITMADALAIVAAAKAAGVHLITGPSHSFDQPIETARALIASGEYGPVRMIHAMNYTDFLYRPRRPEELDTERGGGVIFSQAIHQVDMVRALMGCRATRVTAMTGAWDPARPTEGAYTTIIGFESGGFASLTYSGYAHFDSDSLQGWVGELGTPKDETTYGKARKALASLSSRLTPKGVEIWSDFERSFVASSPDPTPRSPVLRALYNAIRHDTPPLQSGTWGAASLEICHAILSSARGGGSVALNHQ